MELFYNDERYINELLKHDDLYFMWFLLFLQKYNIPKNAKILDVGCGIGSLIKILEKWGFNNVHGVEINETLVQLARQKYNIKNIFTYNEFKNIHEKYDLILSYTVAEHVDEITEFIDFKLNHLKDDGILFIYAPNYHKPKMYLNIIIDKIKKKKIHLTPFSNGSILKSIQMFLKITFFSIYKRIFKKPKMLKVIPLHPDISFSGDADATWRCSYLDMKNYFHCLKNTISCEYLDIFGSLAVKVHFKNKNM